MCTGEASPGAESQESDDDVHDPVRWIFGNRCLGRCHEQLNSEEGASASGTRIGLACNLMESNISPQTPDVGSISVRLSHAVVVGNEGMGHTTICKEKYRG